MAKRRDAGFYARLSNPPEFSSLSRVRRQQNVRTDSVGMYEVAQLLGVRKGKVRF